MSSIVLVGGLKADLSTLSLSGNKTHTHISSGLSRQNLACGIVFLLCPSFVRFSSVRYRVLGDIQTL